MTTAKISGLRGFSPILFLDNQQASAAVIKDQYFVDIKDSIDRNLFGSAIPDNFAALLNPAEVGYRFYIEIDARIKAIRFYKPVGETGIHTGKIWDTEGNLLASVPFDTEAASGWQIQQLRESLYLKEFKTYVVSVNLNDFNSGTTSTTPAIVRKNGILKTALLDNQAGFYNNANLYPSFLAYSNSNYIEYYVDVVCSGTIAPKPFVALQGSDEAISSAYVKNKISSISSRTAHRLHVSADYAARSSTISTNEILDLLNNSANKFWDLLSFDSMYQDATETTLVTADDQSILSVKPITGGLSLTKPTQLSAPKSNQTLGAFFQNTGVSANFVFSRQTNIRTIIACFNMTIPNRSDFVESMMFLGDSTTYDFHPLFGKYFDTTFSSAFIQEGVMRLNNSIVSVNSDIRRIPHCLTLQTTGVVTADNLGVDRGLYDAPYFRSFYGNYRALFISSVVFDEPQIKALTDVLMKFSEIIK